jgi:hypothetical protein
VVVDNLVHIEEVENRLKLALNYQPYMVLY